MLTLLLVTYAAVVVLLYVAQRRLIYLPARGTEQEMRALASDLGVLPWHDTSGAIIGWKAQPRSGIEPANRLVVFHGNAGFALARTHFIAGFGNLDGGKTWDVHLFEYPGFGARRGALGEKPFTDAARNALAQLAAADARPIFLLGESLGSGLACALARAEPSKVGGLLLITPYLRLVDVARHHYPFVPVRLLLRDRWENEAALREFHGRVAVLLAGNDEVIPVAQGRQLFAAANQPKRLWVIAGAMHNRLPFEPSAPWWREVSDFLLGGARAR